MFDQLLNLFGQSPQGQQAYSALQAQGYSPTQSAGILTTAFPAAVTAMQSAMQSNNGQLGLLDIKNSNYAMVFEADAPNAAGSVKPAWQRANNAAQNYQLWSLQAR